MALRTSLSLFRWSGEHRPQLSLISAAGITRFGTSIAYVVLTVVIAQFYSAWLSGVMMGSLNLYQALIADPIAGGLTDRIGSKTVVVFGSVLVGFAGLLWLFTSSTNLIVLGVFGFLLFTGYSFRDEVYAYLLRTSGRREGGFVFGVAENIFAITTFLSTLAVPYFIATDRRMLAGLVMVVCSVISLSIAIGLPNDRRTTAPLQRSHFNPVTVLRKGWHFVKKNDYYPLLLLGDSVFEGVFYGTLWLVMPLAIVAGANGMFAGLTLGIYELVTIFAAAYAGYLADRYNWVRINAIGWTLAAVGSFVLLFSTQVIWLVFIGAVIAIGNNLFAFAASHALELNDIDHAEDGAFVGLNNLVIDFGYGLAPLLIGALYYVAGFTVAMGLATCVTIVLACVMIPLARRLASRRHV